MMVLGAASHAQYSSSAPSATAGENTVSNANGTSTFTKRDEKGGITQQVEINSDGSVNRRTLLQYDQAGHCLSWRSIDAHGTVDSGELYIFDAGGVLIRMQAADGSVLYQK